MIDEAAFEKAFLTYSEARCLHDVNKNALDYHKERIHKVIQAYESARTPADVVERIGEWHCNRQTNRVRRNGGAASLWHELLEKTRAEYREWARELLQIAAMQPVPVDVEAQELIKLVHWLEKETERPCVATTEHGLELYSSGKASRTKQFNAIRAILAATKAVKCWDCDKMIESIGEWYRCFDCKSYLCEGCVTDHFGKGYTPHHGKIEMYKRQIEILQHEVAACKK